MTFFSLDELNQEIKKWLVDYNNRLLTRKGASRKELFQSVERSYLKPLPSSGYELKDYRRAKVQKMGYVYFSPDKNYYSVPHRYIGKSTQIHYTRSTVEVFYNHERIASHQRNPAMGIYITNKDHLSSTHKAYTEWSPAYFEKKAAKHGVHVVACIQGVISNSIYPEIAYKRAMGIIQLHRTYDSERLNNACKRAVEAGAFSYKRIQNILKNNLDKEDAVEQVKASNTPHIPVHENLHGASAYQ
ncbi:Mu transposase domain-containing protein [Carboxylicivirga marina]|uniref:Transposase for insertion sequence element IS21-like C-terminal domain-containing protein n=1 Tax=Carboxylicivirga marina TaxID=2800988 RepID=A0ABS1HKR6_9BACT|nr:hypothetical protein [Carboxylicivirga marina]MBK3518273.1 hypothetical protein [Carboxylicivirga marina]